MYKVNLFVNKGHMLKVHLKLNNSQLKYMCKHFAAVSILISHFG